MRMSKHIVLSLLLYGLSISILTAAWTKEDCVKKWNEIRTTLTKGSFEDFSKLVIPGKQGSLTKESFDKNKVMFLQLLPDPAKNEVVGFKENGSKAVLIFKGSSSEPNTIVLNSVTFVNANGSWKMDADKGYIKSFTSNGTDENAQIQKAIDTDPKLSLTGTAAAPDSTAAKTTPSAPAQPAASPGLPALPDVGVKFKKFRSGKILAAEITTKKVLISNPNQYDLPQMYKKPDDREDSEAQYAFASVAVKLDPNRSIGKYDYTLSDGANEFKCFAISEGDSAFDFKTWEVKDTKKICKLLYEVKLPPVQMDKIQYSLSYNLLDLLTPELIVPFTNLGNKDFTPSKKIPDMGILPIEAPTRPGATPSPGLTPGTPPPTPAAPKAPAPKKKPGLDGIGADFHPE